jgi:hypothetical protein
MRIWAITFSIAISGVLAGCGTYLDSTSISNNSEVNASVAVSGRQDFGAHFVYNTSYRTLTFENNSQVTITDLIVENLSSPFSVITNHCSNEVPAQSSCTIGLSFSPNSTGAFVDEVIIRYTVADKNYSESVEIMGTSEAGVKLLGTDDGTQGSPQGNFFGSAIAIGHEYIAIGAHRDGPNGSVYLYQFDGSSWNFSERITGPAGSDWFGRALAISNTWLMVGAPHSSGGGSTRGRVYIYELSGSTWSQHADSPIEASDPQDGALFGKSLALRSSPSQANAIIGAPGFSGEGKAYVFDWDNGSDNWVEDETFTGDADTSHFGFSVSLNNWDNTASHHIYAVGAYGDTEGGLPNAGAVYTYRDESSGFPLLEKITPSDAIADHNFGESISLRNRDLLISADGDADNGVGSGAAYLYRFDGSSWNFIRKFAASDAAAGDSFGQSVTIQGERYFISADEASPLGMNGGILYQYEQINGSWYERKFISDQGTSDARLGQRFAISGDIVVVGAPWDSEDGTDAGAAYIYDLKTMARQHITHPATSSGEFGNQCDIDGNFAAITDRNGGGIVLYERNTGGNWAHLQTVNPNPSAFYMAPNLRDDVLVFGDEEYNSDQGAMYVYRRDGTSYAQEDFITYSSGTTGEDFGQTIELSEDLIAVGADEVDGGGTARGAVILYEYDGSDWVENSTLIEAWDPEDGAQFGESVSVDGNVMVVSAQLHDNDGVPGDQGVDEGTAYVYRYDGSDWQFEQRLSLADASETENGAYFGAQVDVDGSWLMVAAPEARVNGVDRVGAIYAYQYNGTSWIFEQKIVKNPNSSSEGSRDLFGASMELVGDTLITIDDEDVDVRDTVPTHIFRLDSNTNTWEKHRSIYPRLHRENVEDRESICHDGTTALTGIALQPIPGSSDTGIGFFWDLNLLNPFE